MSRKNNGVTNTVVSYDGIAKRLLDNMDDEKMIDFINHVFTRTFESGASVTRLATETYDRETKQKRCDYFVKINDDMFLIEIQSYEDEEMALRIFEYGSRGAVLHGRKNTEDDTIDIQFPEPVVFYLRKGEKVHDRLSVRIHRSGSDEEYRYDARVIYVEDYDISSLIETGMYPLIPFYPMRYEKILDRKHSENDENNILKDFELCYQKLSALLKTGKLGVEYYQFLKESVIKVFDGVVNRMNRSGKLKKNREAKELMQKMVDEPIEMFDIFKALEESREEGIEKGKNEAAVVMKYISRNYSPEKNTKSFAEELVTRFGISTDEACEYLNMYLED